MKTLVTALALATLCASSLVLAQAPATQPTTKPAQTQPADDMFKTQMEKVSYVIGAGFGSNLAANAKRSDVDLDTDMIVQGVKDALAGKPKLTETQMRETMMAFSQEVQAKMQEKQTREAEENKKAGEEFLAKNAKQEGVITLPSGLQYKVVEEGKGPTPAATDTVDVKYRGTLIDGTEFDSSGDTTRPFPVSGVVRGMSEALQKMPVGSKWKLFIPGDLAYGPRAASDKIGPNATLLFDVELVSIQPKPEGAATQPGMPQLAPTTRPNIQLRSTPSTQPAAK